MEEGSDCRLVWSTVLTLLIIVNYVQIVLQLDIFIVLGEVSTVDVWGELTTELLEFP
jgi:hypothetical protein